MPDGAAPHEVLQRRIQLSPGLPRPATASGREQFGAHMLMWTIHSRHSRYFEPVQGLVARNVPSVPETRTTQWWDVTKEIRHCHGPLCESGSLVGPSRIAKREPLIKLAASSIKFCSG